MSMTKTYFCSSQNMRGAMVTVLNSQLETLFWHMGVESKETGSWWRIEASSIEKKLIIFFKILLDTLVLLTLSLPPHSTTNIHRMRDRQADRQKHKETEKGERKWLWKALNTHCISSSSLPLTMSWVPTLQLEHKHFFKKFFIVQHVYLTLIWALFLNNWPWASPSLLRASSVN